MAEVQVLTTSYDRTITFQLYGDDLIINTIVVSPDFVEIEYRDRHVLRVHVHHELREDIIQDVSAQLKSGTLTVEKKYEYKTFKKIFDFILLQKTVQSNVVDIFTTKTVPKNVTNVRVQGTTKSMPITQFKNIQVITSSKNDVDKLTTPQSNQNVTLTTNENTTPETYSSNNAVDTPTTLQSNQNVTLTMNENTTPETHSSNNAVDTPTTPQNNQNITSTTYEMTTPETHMNSVTKIYTINIICIFAGMLLFLAIAICGRLKARNRRTNRYRYN